MAARRWVLAFALLLGTTGAASAEDHSGLIQDLLSANLEARELAEKRLVAIGAPAVPELLRVVATGDFEAAAAATEVILDMGSPATEPLVRGLNGSAKERRIAFSLLVRLGSSAKAAVPAMIVALGEKDRITRRSAAQVLSRIGPPAAAAVPALTAALRDDSASVRFLAAEALGAIGFRATPARAALSALANDAKQSDPVREAARVAIERIDRAPRPPDAAGADPATPEPKPPSPMPPVPQPQPPVPEHKPPVPHPKPPTPEPKHPAPKAGTSTGFGLTVGELTPEVKRRYGGEIEGVLVLKVAPDREELEMIRPGDVLVDVGEQTVGSVAAFEKQARRLASADEIVLVFRRGEETFFIVVGSGE